MIRRLIYALADSPGFTRWLSRRGMRWGFARRFVAGESLQEAMPAVRELRDRDMLVTLDYLGESVRDEEATREATRAYCRILEELHERDNIASISLKPTQLGLAIDTGLARENIGTIAARAAELDNFVRIDMEDSSTTEATLQAFKALHPQHDNLGVVIQSYLYRSQKDLRELNDMGAKVRLCKGAYKEPPEVAYQDKSDVDANYMKLAEMLLDRGNYPAFATHDHRIIDQIVDGIEQRGMAADQYEFQMLYGVRRDYQKRIVEGGHRIRIYVPFGAEWCPYFMRRIAERPANALFVLRALAGG